MKVLLLTQVLPFPPDSGPKIKTWNVLKCLARTHEVTLVSFARGGQSEAVQRLRDLCAEVRVVPLRRGSGQDVWALGRSLATGHPWLMLRDDRRAMRAAVDDVALKTPFDIVHADQLNMAQYALRLPAAIRILDAHNALSALYSRLAGTTRGLGFRWLYRREARLLRAYEGEIGRQFNLILTVTEADRASLSATMESVSGAGPARRPWVIPIAVDTQELQVRPVSESADHILHIGTMYWPPNVDGVRWFVDRVMPLIRRQRPQSVLDVLGANPPPDLKAHNSNGGGIRVTGYVADASPFVEAAGVYVVPLLAGGGMRVKILTAMAQGIPVVSTRVGCEGIDAQPGKDLLVADSPIDFAQATVRVLSEPDLARELARNGRRLVERKYSLPQLAGQLEAAYQAAWKVRLCTPSE